MKERAAKAVNQNDYMMMMILVVKLLLLLLLRRQCHSFVHNARLFVE